MRLAILAFTVLALTGVAYAQDDNGGGDGDNTATPIETAVPDASTSEAPASDDASTEAVLCSDGKAPPCAAAPLPAASNDDPFASVSWEGTSYDSSSALPSFKISDGH